MNRSPLFFIFCALLTLLALKQLAEAQTTPPRITKKPELDAYIESIEYLKLGACPQASQVRKAYHEMARFHHPDKQGDEGTMRYLNSLYKQLTNYIKTYRPEDRASELPSPGVRPMSNAPAGEPISEEEADHADILKEVQETHLPPITVETQPPAPPPAPPPLPTLLEENILFDPYTISFEEIYTLLRYDFYTNVCKKKTPEQAAQFEQSYAQGLSTMALYLHAAIGAFARSGNYTTRLEKFNLVQAFINNPFMVVATITNILAVCGPISYGGVLNSCFDMSVVNTLKLNDQKS